MAVAPPPAHRVDVTRSACVVVACDGPAGARLACLPGELLRGGHVALLLQLRQRGPPLADNLPFRQMQEEWRRRETEGKAASRYLGVRKTTTGVACSATGRKFQSHVPVSFCNHTLGLVRHCHPHHAFPAASPPSSVSSPAAANTR